MGEYFVLANLTKRQFIDPNVFGENIKASGLYYGVHGAVIRLLLRTPSLSASQHPLLGAWIGDVVQSVGDYTAARDLFSPDAPPNVHARYFVLTSFEDLSYAGFDLLCTYEPAYAAHLVDWITRYTSLEHRLLVTMGDVVVRFGTTAVQAALHDQFGAAWTAAYLDAGRAAASENGYRTGMLHHAHRQAVIEQHDGYAIPIGHPIQSLPDDDLLLVNVAKYHYVSASFFRVPHHRARLPNDWVMLPIHHLMDRWDGCWVGDPFIFVGSDASPAYAKLLASAQSTVPRDLSVEVRTTCADITDVLLDQLELDESFGTFMHDKFAHTRSYPIDVFLVPHQELEPYDPFLMRRSEPKLKALAVHLKQYMLQEEQRRDTLGINHRSGTFVDDHGHAVTFRWLAQFTDYDTLAEDFNRLGTWPGPDLDWRWFREVREDERGWLVWNHADVAEVQDRYLRYPCVRRDQTQELANAEVWQQLVETQLPSNIGLLLVQLQMNATA